MRREHFQRLLRKHARHNALHPARKAAPDVGNRFALAQMRVRVVEVNRRAAQAGNAHFKRDPRAQRRLFKNHRQKPPGQRGLVAVRMRLDVRGQVEQFLHLRGIPFRAGQQIRKRGSTLGSGLGPAHSCSPRGRKRHGSGGGGRCGRRLGGPLGLREDRFDFGKSFLHLLRGQNERRQQAQDVFVRAVDEQALLERFGNVRSALTSNPGRASVLRRALRG